MQAMIDKKVKVYEEMMEREKDQEKKAIWHFVISDLKGGFRLVFRKLTSLKKGVVFQKLISEVLKKWK